MQLLAGPRRLAHSPVVCKLRHRLQYYPDQRRGIRWDYDKLAASLDSGIHCEGFYAEVDHALSSNPLFVSDGIRDPKLLQTELANVVQTAESNTCARQPGKAKPRPSDTRIAMDISRAKHDQLMRLLFQTEFAANDFSCYARCRRWLSYSEQEHSVVACWPETRQRPHRNWSRHLNTLGLPNISRACGAVPDFCQVGTLVPRCVYSLLPQLIIQQARSGYNTLLSQALTVDAQLLHVIGKAGNAIIPAMMLLYGPGMLNASLTLQKMTTRAYATQYRSEECAAPYLTGPSPRKYTDFFLHLGSTANDQYLVLDSACHISLASDIKMLSCVYAYPSDGSTRLPYHGTTVKANSLIKQTVLCLALASESFTPLIHWVPVFIACYIGVDSMRTTDNWFLDMHMASHASTLLFNIMQWGGLCALISSAGLVCMLTSRMNSHHHSTQYVIRQLGQLHIHMSSPCYVSVIYTPHVSCEHPLEPSTTMLALGTYKVMVLLVRSSWRSITHAWTLSCRSPISHSLMRVIPSRVTLSTYRCKHMLTMCTILLSLILQLNRWLRTWLTAMIR